MKFEFFSDPGHGWLKVPGALLRELGIVDKITPYSYAAAGFGFLEEDCDASLFLATARQAGLAITFRDVTCADRHSRIRNYDPYSPERARKNLANLRGAVL